MSEFHPTKISQDAYIQQWYDQETSDEAARTLLVLLEALAFERAYIDRRYRKAIELYENVECGNLVAWQYMTDTDVDGIYQYNLIESIIDTVQAEIITNRTRPQFFTDGGDWESKERAKLLTSFMSGVFSENKIYKKVAPQVCLDALIFGTGFVKVYEEDGRLKADRCFPPEVVVDEVEAALSGGKPRNMYYVRHLPKSAVLGMFEDDPVATQKILSAGSVSFEARGGFRTHLDIVVLAEAWHLPCGDSDKGRHTIICGDACLVDEDYGNDFFPFVSLRYKERTKGFLGKGIPEILEGQQELINDLRDKINAQILGSAPFIWSPPGAKLTESEISNRIWRVIESETPPQYVAYNSVPTDLLSRLQSEIAEAGMLVGANALMLRSELPPGLNSGSGRALRIYNDTKSKRFMRFARAYEDFHIELSDLFLKIADCATDYFDAKIETVYEAGGYIKKLSYDDIRLKDGLYVIRPEPINFLSDTPSGRLSDIEALASIFPEQMKSQLVSLLDNPDIRSISNYLNADQDAIEKACSSILRGEKTSGQVAPNEYLDLQLCVQISRRILLEAQTAGAPVERLLELENWIGMVQSMIQKANEPQAPPPQEMAPENTLSQPLPEGGI